MAQIKIYGFDEVIRKINNAEKNSSKIVGKAIYEGASIAADALKKAVRDLPLDERHGTQDSPLNGIKKLQRIGLEKGLGIAPMQEDKWFQNVKIGFDGYNLIKTKKYPNGQPNAMIARSVESGTSFSQKIPFIRKTIKQIRPDVQNRMSDTFKEESEKILK